MPTLTERQRAALLIIWHTRGGNGVPSDEWLREHALPLALDAFEDAKEVLRELQATHDGYRLEIARLRELLRVAGVGAETVSEQTN